MADQVYDVLSTRGAPVTRWQTLALSDAPWLKLIEKPVKGIDAIVTFVDTIAGIATAYANLLAKLATDLTDPEKLGITAAISTIRAMLKDLAGPAGAGVHVIAFDAMPSLDPELTPAINVFGDIDSLLKKPAGKLANVAMGIRGTAGGGGNAGFMGQLTQSLEDDMDTFRPQYDDDAYMAGVLLYFGSETFQDLLTVIAKLATLFSDGKRPGPLDEALKSIPLPNFPAIQNLRTELTPYKTGETKPILTFKLSDMTANFGGRTPEPPFLAVKFAWDSILSYYYTSPYPDENGDAVKFKIKDVVLYGDKAPLPVNDPVELAKRKILTMPFKTFMSFVSVNGFASPGLWYFGASLEVYRVTKMGEAESEDTLAEQVSLAEVVQTSLFIPEDSSGLSRQGPSPNWSAMRPIAIIPALRDITIEIEAFLDQLEKYLGSKSDQIKKYIEAVTTWVNDYIAWIQELTTTLLKLIKALLDWPKSVFAGAHAFAGKGGNSFMVNSIGKALFDTSDTGRPPFDTGTEAVYGIIAVAGSETPGKIQNLMTFFELLFNVKFGENGEVVQSFKEIGNATLDAIASLDVALSSISNEIAIYDDSLQLQEQTDALSTNDTTTGTTTETKKLAFDIQMNPSTYAEGCKC
jgi:hypothetical protein